MEVRVPKLTDTDITALIESAEVRRAVSPTHKATEARKRFKMPVCDAFKGNATVLRIRDEFRFDIDPHTRQQLPDIINNRVQSVVSAEAGPQYNQPRNIGIVFSGGPAPGGHNVIAGLYDAARKANPENRVFGFLVGPDGIIEGEYIELTDAMVDAYRNLGGFTIIKTGQTKI